ncbi:MAG: diguanylate cyclase, partial [Inhella sp.]
MSGTRSPASPGGVADGTFNIAICGRPGGDSGAIPGETSGSEICPSHGPANPMPALAPVPIARVLLAWLLPVLLVLMPAAASPAREPEAVTDLSALAAGQAVALVESMQVLQQPLGQVSQAAEVLARPGWRPATVANRNASWKRSAVWLTGLVTQHGDRPLACRITLGPTRIGTVEMLALDAQTGALLARRLEGPRMLERARTVDHLEAMLPFDLAPGQTVRLLIRAEDLTVATTEVHARDESAYVRHQALSLLGEAVMFTLTLLLCLLVLCSRDRGMIVVGGWLLAGVCFESLFSGQLLLMLLPALLPWNVGLFTLLGALCTGLFGVASLVLLRLDVRQRWPMMLLASAVLGVIVGLSAFAVTDTNPARKAVNLIGFVTLLLWPLAAWRSPTPLDEERHRLRWMLTLSWAVLLVYVMLARGAPHPQALQLLQDELRLDRLVIGATLMVQFSIWRNRRRAAMRRTEFLAFHDALTGLPNRVSAVARRQQALDRLAPEPDATLAVLYLDLDKFKQVNDTHG